MDFTRFVRSPDLPGLEIRYSYFSDYNFPKHSHESYSIGLIDKGQTVFWLRGKHYSICSGEIAVIGPGEIHACSPRNKDWSYRMLHIQPQFLDSLASDVGLEKDTYTIFIKL